jgi:predicted RNA-binding Zn-ribbon protein involved in translation (DUF1610 family)
MKKDQYGYVICICKDCEIDFLVRRTERTKKYFCPHCGENIYTEKQKTIYKDEGFYKFHTLYTEEEDDFIRHCKQMKMSYTQIAKLMGRTYRGVQNRGRRIGLADKRFSR